MFPWIIAFVSKNTGILILANFILSIVTGVLAAMAKLNPNQGSLFMFAFVSATSHACGSFTLAICGHFAKRWEEEERLKKSESLVREWVELHWRNRELPNPSNSGGEGKQPQS